MSRRRGLLALVLILCAAAPAGASARARWDTRVLGLVPNPGFPAHAYVHPDGRVYEGTYDNPSGDSVPSRVLEYSAPADDVGTLVRSWTVQGQNLNGPHGVQAATSDRFGRLILLDKSPPRILALDRDTGEQTTLAYLPAGAVPNYAAWDTDRNLYVTDYENATIWRLREGSNRVTAWLQAPVLDGMTFGTTGIVLTADRKSFVVSQQSEAGLGAGNPTTGRLLRIPITADGSPGPVSQIWESRPFDGPDGFAISASGAFYVTLLVTNQIAVIGPDGTERERFPPDPFTGANGSAVPFDNPSSARFLGTRLMVANQSFIMGDPTHMAILDVETGEAGLPEYVPPPPKAAKKAKAKKKKTKLRVSVSPKTVRAGRRVRLRFTVKAGKGKLARAVKGATVTLAGARAKTDSRGRATIRRRFARAGKRTATVRAAGFATTRVTVRIRR